MRRALPYLVALVLGAGAALLAACAYGPEGGVPANAAADLNSQLEDVRLMVDSAECDRLSRELRQVITRIDGLPSSVDPQLQRRLRDGYDTLKEQALKECNSNREEQQPTTPTTETEPEPEPQTTQTQTQTETQTQPQTPTQTVPQLPAQTTPAPPPPPVDTQPPAPPGGGTPPEVGP